MGYEEFVSDLPLRGRISFSSAEENEEAMRRYDINQQVRQIGRGSFRSDMAMCETDQAFLIADRFNQSSSLYLEPPSGMVIFVVFRSAGGRFLASGESVGNDKLVVLPDGSGTDLISPNLAGSEGIIIPNSRYTELIEVLCPTCVRPDRMVAIKGNSSQFQFISDAVLNAVGNPGSSSHDEWISNLVAQTVVWSGHYFSQYRSEATGRQARVRIAKQVQEFIEEHYCETVRSEDLCCATGKGIRTLQRCFSEYFDLSITEYLKTVRLNAAHRALIATRPGEESVTSIALRKGFNHIGRFSVEYTKLFGESPRQTLRNTPSG